MYERKREFLEHRVYVYEFTKKMHAIGKVYPV